MNADIWETEERQDKEFERVSLPVPPDGGENWIVNKNISKSDLLEANKKYQNICGKQVEEEFEKYRSNETDNFFRSTPLKCDHAPLPPDEGYEYLDQEINIFELVKKCKTREDVHSKLKHVLFEAIDKTDRSYAKISEECGFDDIETLSKVHAGELNLNRNVVMALLEDLSGISLDKILPLNIPEDKKDELLALFQIDGDTRENIYGENTGLELLIRLEILNQL